MKKYLYLFILVFILTVSGYLVYAQTGDPFSEITYPVAELSDCKDKSSCEAYCEKPENMAPCLDFAQEHNLMPEEDIEIGRKMLATGETSGPGGCRGVAECGDYCDNISHIQECVDFAEEHDLMPPEKLEEAKKVAAAMGRGITPPNNCQSKEDCDVYCSQPENIKECIIFAKEAGLMPPEDIEEAEKVLAALEKGIQPPPCGGKDECDEYCSEPEHFEECITFAEAAGFMSADEAAMIRRTGGQGPGGCRGKEACEAYCDDPANMEPCINFAIENGFMSPEEAEQAKKMLAAGFTSGPGGCREEEECRSFCGDPANLEECINFAVQIGDMSPEEADQARQRLGEMEEINRKMQECLTMSCAEAFACFQSLQPEGEDSQSSEGGEGVPEGMMGGMDAEVQAKLESCAQEMQQQFQEGMMPEGVMPPGGEIPEYDESRGGPAPFIPQGPSQEEINKMMEEETQRKMQQITEEEQQRRMQAETDRMMEEEGRRIMEQQAPPPAEQPPQSFLNQVTNFLAGLGLSL